MPAPPPYIPSRWNLYQGDDSEMTMVVEDGEASVDLTYYSGWKALWRSAPPYEDVTMYLLVDDSLAQLGVIKVKATATITAMMPNYGQFDLTAVHESGDTRTFVRGATMLIKKAA